MVQVKLLIGQEISGVFHEQWSVISVPPITANKLIARDLAEKYVVQPAPRKPSTSTGEPK